MRESFNRAIYYFVVFYFFILNFLRGLLLRITSFFNHTEREKLSHVSFFRWFSIFLTLTSYGGMEMDESKMIRKICVIFSILAVLKKHKILSRIHVKLKKKWYKVKTYNKIKTQPKYDKALGLLFFFGAFFWGILIMPACL